MTIRNRIIAATMSVAIALPLMATTASAAPTDGQARTHPKAEQIAEQHCENARINKTALRGNDQRGHRTERREVERKDSDND